jgi:histone acetyltransferase (RNA polymerase elongator complex component)
MLSVKHYTIPVFVPELACPFQCAFCNQRKISGQITIPQNNEIINSIEEHLRSFKKQNRYVEVGFFGGSFTGIDLDEQIRYLSLVQPYVESGQVQSIRLSTRPDYINQHILTMIKKMNIGTIELGAQSMDDEVLKLSRRGHNSQQIKDASMLILENGFKLGLQMMLGLPGDNLERAMNTAQQIIDAGADNTRIYPALVIKDTLMHKWYNEGRYKPLSMDEAVEWTSRIMPLFEENNVNVIRVGLHPSEGLLSGDEIIDGPFHQSFRELVSTKIWGRILENMTDKIDNGKSIEISVNKKELNYAIGYKQVNRMELRKKYKKVIFKTDNKLNSRKAKIREL